MIKFFLFFFVTLISFNVSSNENLLTIQQQLERLQREVSDLSQTVFLNNDSSKETENRDLVSNLSAIDMRIYDLEKDVKSLTGNLEEIFFQIEDLVSKINNIQESMSFFEQKISEIQVNKSQKESDFKDINQSNSENTLGSIKITSENNNTLEENENSIIDNDETTNETIEELSPEDEFQAAFDNIRNKRWEEAKNSLIKFIENNPDNQLSGSAHYWLGELYILEKKFRDSALIFAEGYQKFPKSIKAPDMLFKLSESLYKVEKFEESCKTLEKLIIDFPKNKLVKNSKKQIQDQGCLDLNE